MQERKKKKIVIASVLKPADESRMCGKIGFSLANAGHLIYCIGNGSSNESPHSSISLISLHVKQRLSFQRLISPWRVLIKSMQLKPHVFICCTHELLIVALLLKLFFRTAIVYDVQENYFLNIRYTNAFPALIKTPIAYYVRLKEWVLSPFINHFILAEKIYQQQLHFTAKANTILENKLSKRFAERIIERKDFHRILFSGTISESTGVWQAIEVATALHAIDAQFSLTIIGFAPQRKTLENILAFIHNKPFVKLIANENPLGHSLIIEQIKQADVGFIYYPPNKHTEGRIPTKYYEYLTLGLNILSVDNQIIKYSPVELNKRIVFWEKEAPETTINHLKEMVYNHPIDPSFYWESQETALRKLIDSL